MVQPIDNPAGSSSDSDTLDSLDSTQFVRSDANDSLVGSYTVTGDWGVDNLNLNGNTLSSTDTNGNITFAPDGTGEVQIGGARVLTTGDEGTGNGLDADTVDGIEVAALVRSDTDDSLVGSYDVTGDLSIDNLNLNGNTLSSTDTNGNIIFSPDGTGNVLVGANRVLTVADEGTGNGLDADTLDGVEGASYVRSDASDSLVGDYDITGSLVIDSLTFNAGDISTADGAPSIPITITAGSTTSAITGPPASITATAGDGAASSGTDAFPGSAGGAFTITAGDGGTSTSSSGGGSGGNGGDTTINSGDGGNSTSARGGAGGDIIVNSGDGGTSAAASPVGTTGQGGDVTFSLGNGGTASGAVGGGRGGDFSITTGTGGNTASDFSNAGDGGDITLTTGSGGTSSGSSSDGTSGVILIQTPSSFFRIRDTQIDANVNSNTSFTDDGSNFTIGTSHFTRTVTAGITASTTQSQGQGALTSDFNEVSTVANTNDTVTLPTAVAGMEISIINNGANTLQIFPASGDDLGSGVDTSTTLATSTSARFISYDATNWAQII